MQFYSFISTFFKFPHAHKKLYAIWRKNKQHKGETDPQLTSLTEVIS